MGRPTPYCVTMATGSSTKFVSQLIWQFGTCVLFLKKIFETIHYILNCEENYIVCIPQLITLVLPSLYILKGHNSHNNCKKKAWLKIDRICQVKNAVTRLFYLRNMFNF